VNVVGERRERSRDDGLHARRIAQFAHGLRVEDAVHRQAGPLERGPELRAVNDLEIFRRAGGRGEVCGRFLGKEAAELRDVAIKVGEICDRDRLLAGFRDGIGELRSELLELIVVGQDGLPDDERRAEKNQRARHNSIDGSNSRRRTRTLRRPFYAIPEHSLFPQ